MLYADAKIWLPDDLLMKADKMTMANGMELRVPFLDHTLVEFAATLPDAMKLGWRRGKSLLRQALDGVVPPEIIYRSKKGFPVPTRPWLRGQLRETAREALLASGAACAGYMDRRVLKEIVEQNESGQADRQQEMWTLLVFEFWHKVFVEKRFAPPSRDEVLETVG
jgi:asparagine synthase (glutamine-hydrolysing)